MRAGFPASPAKPLAQARYPRVWHRPGAALAASVIALAVGIGSGVLGYLCADKGVFGGAVQDQSQRIVLHLDESQPDRFRSVLDYAEQFLRRHSEGGAQVEVVANASGIDLVTSGVSPYEERVRAMMQQYPNLHFIACANSIRQLRLRGANAGDPRQPGFRSSPDQDRLHNRNTDAPPIHSYTAQVMLRTAPGH